MTRLATPRRPSARDPFECYLSEIDDTPLLTADEEQELAARVAEGDLEARDQMVRANLRLVVNIARGYANRGMTMDDLVAEGNMGLLRAVEGYDPAYGTRFNTYAVYWIRQSIQRGFNKTGPATRLPQYVARLAAKWRREATAIREATGRAATDAEIAARLELSRGQVKAVKRALNAIAGDPTAGRTEDEEGDRLQEVVADERTAAPDEALAGSEQLALALGSLDRLAPREQQVVRLRFGLGGGEPQTLKQIGEALGYTRERVRQIECEALLRLRSFIDPN